MPVPQPKLENRVVRSPAPRFGRVYGASPLGEALFCDVTLASALTCEGRAQLSAATRDGAMLAVAERRKRAARAAAAGASATLHPRVSSPRCAICQTPFPAHPCRPAKCGRARVAPAVGSIECGFANHPCCHTAGGCWRHARCAAARAGGRVARRGPAYTQPPGPVGRPVHWDPDLSWAVAKKRAEKILNPGIRYAIVPAC